MVIWETLSNNGSPLGTLLLVYGTMCYGLSSGRAKVEPFNRSIVETSFFFTIIRLLSVPAFFWVAVYLIGHLGFLKGLAFLAVSGIAMSLLINLTGFTKAPGLHLFLSLPALVVGFLLTIKTHPF